MTQSAAARTAPAAPTASEPAATAAPSTSAPAGDAAAAAPELSGRRTRRTRPAAEAAATAQPRLVAVPEALVDVPAAAAAQPVELHVEPVVVAEPLLAAASAADPIAVDEPTIDLDHTRDDVEAVVEPGPAHTILDDEEPARADAFERAARTFSFTGEMPVVATASAPVEAISVVSDLVPRRRRGFAKRLAAASVSLSALAMVGLLTVGMTTPAQAVATATAAGANPALAGDVTVSAAASGEVQAFVAPSTSTGATLDRPENYSTGTMVDLAGTEGIIHYSSQYFSNDTKCPVQWPFATGTTISYGFGQREGEFHEGVDFTPGEGAHIQAVSDGIVSTSTDSGGGYGVTIVIDIVVDGRPWSIRYGHMLYGSRQVQVGDHVSVGEFIGETGDTGYSFGAHTHVEVLQNRTTPIDPMPWFAKYNVC